MFRLLTALFFLLILSNNGRGQYYQCPQVCPTPQIYYYQNYCPPSYYIPTPTYYSFPVERKAVPAPFIKETRTVTPKKVERLIPVPSKTVKPVIVFPEEIVTTNYLEATMPSGNTQRIPVINGLLPNIRVTYHNGTLERVEFDYQNPSPQKFTGKTGDKVLYRTGPNGPGIGESVQTQDQQGNRIEELQHQYSILVYLPDRVVPALVLPTPDELGIPPTVPDSKLKRPSEIEM